MCHRQAFVVTYPPVKDLGAATRICSICATAVQNAIRIFTRETGPPTTLVDFLRMPKDGVARMEMFARAVPRQEIGWFLDQRESPCCT